ncbi:MAG: alpha/beta hydrolase [Bacteroidetes bacterium]|nr:alpha/beta hydrolase [Bacteroidota bacterium]
MNFRTLALHNMLRLYKNIGQSAYNNPKLARAAFERLTDLLPSKLDTCTYEELMIGDTPAEWITPKKGASSDRVLLFIHGGGYATGSIRTHRALASQIAVHAGLRALSIDYKLAPEHRFPTQINEAVAAYKFLIKQGYKPHQIAIGGESAGAGLSAGTLLYLRDHNVPLPACAILMSPWLDLTASGSTIEGNKHKDPMVPYKGIPLWAQNYAGPDHLTDPYASPLFGDLHGLCPIYIQVGECEILLSDSTRFADKAKLAGVDIVDEVWPNMFHAWQGFWMVMPEGMAAIEKLSGYIREKLDAAKPRRKANTKSKAA